MVIVSIVFSEGSVPLRGVAVGIVGSSTVITGVRFAESQAGFFILFGGMPKTRETVKSVKKKAEKKQKTDVFLIIHPLLS